jgi:chromosome segregation ATPase
MMAPPVSSARSQLFELRSALRTLEDNLSEHERRITELSGRLGNSNDVEAELRQLDLAESEAFHLAAQSEDPCALDAVKTDPKKRADLQKKLATARARRAGVEKAISEVQSLQREAVNGRNAARAVLPVFEMLVLVDELVPAAL